MTRSIDYGPLRHVFDIVPVGILILTSGKAIFHANPTARALLGADTPQLLGRTWEDFRVSAEGPSDSRVSSSDVQQIQPVTGPLIWVKVTFTDVSRERDPYSLITFQDVTAIIQQKEALMRSNTELEQFAAIASHDLQEPLRLITAFGTLLEKSLEDMPDESQKHLQAIIRQGRRMQDLVSDLLTYSRVNRKGNPFTPVDLSQIIQAVKLDLLQSISESGASLNWTPLPTVDADHVQIAQMFRNLISNSIKFRSKDRPLTISIQGHVHEGHAVVLFDDNGIGFDPVYKDRIFEPFKRLHGASKYAGTGMGLAICQRIAYRHQGTIQAMGTLDKGSVFRIVLPVHQDPT